MGYSKDAKIPRTTAWRNYKKEMEIVGSCTLTDSPSTALHNQDDFTEYSVPAIVETCTDYEKASLSTQPLASSSDNEQVTNALFGEEQSNQDPTDEFFSLLVDVPTESDSETSEESESDD